MLDEARGEHYLVEPMPALADEIFDALLGRIVAEEWPAGTRLPPERDLATELQANRHTVREAIRRLEQARLVTVRQGQGVTVQNFREVAGLEILGPYLKHGTRHAEKMQVILDLLEPRRWLFEQLVSLAATRCTSQDLNALERAQKACEQAESDHDAIAFIHAQIAWADALINATHNQPMRWMANPFMKAVAEFLSAYAQIMVFKPSFANMAEQVNQALEAHDGSSALGHVREFYEGVDLQLKSLLQASASLTS